MSKEDAFAYGIAGATAWLAVTAFYGAFGGGILESSFLAYAANAALATPSASLPACAARRAAAGPCRP